jgi:hypothetical protein
MSATLNLVHAILCRTFPSLASDILHIFSGILLQREVDNRLRTTKRNEKSLFYYLNVFSKAIITNDASRL